jgi:serine/threonine protein kinase
MTNAITCPSCQKEITEGARFCVHCGAQVADPLARTMLVDEESESDVLLRSLSRELAGDYKIERELGRGGMAIVYEAVDVHLGRRVALKVLPPEMAIRKSMAERFKREAKMAAALDHPNIVPVYRVGQTGGLLYIAMKYIKGRALDSILETQGPLPIPVVLGIMRAAAGALAYAHERGIVHRDVKSANIMIDTDGRAVVSDFGIARAVDDPNLTGTGTVVGTPYFMSPEQCAARRIGPQSDQYSLGVVAFQMLMGTVPFSADTLPGIMHHHFYTTVPDLRTARPEIPQALSDIIVRLLAKKSEDRYASTSALATAILDIPLSESDRRDAESVLRDLAGGAPAPRIMVDKLAMVSSVRLTPNDGRSILAQLQRRMSIWAVALAAGLVLAVTGASALWTVTSPTGVSSADDGGRSALAIQWGRARRMRAARDSARIADSVSAANAKAESARLASAASARESRSVTPSASPRQPAAIVDGGKVRLRVYPANAQIFVDDRLMGTGIVIDSVLSAGTRHLRVSAQGFEPFETTFEIAGGQTTSLSPIKLKVREGGG